MRLGRRRRSSSGDRGVVVILVTKRGPESPVFARRPGDQPAVPPAQIPWN
ncbi:hypothetical protein ACFPRL_26645 [Pseudoclavibacter helvolus]